MKNKYNDMKVEELEKVYEDLSDELRDMKFRQVVGELNNPMRKRTVRRSMAQVLTILNEYKKGIRKKAE